MRERLIELIKEADKKVDEVLFSTKKPLSSEEWGAIFADYLLENGVVVLPCKVGDTVYQVFPSGNEPFYEKQMVTEIEYSACREDYTIWCGIGHFDKLDLNKYIFLTQKEAEKAMEKEMRR